jgi:hypothetical protein
MSKRSSACSQNPKGYQAFARKIAQKTERNVIDMSSIQKTTPKLSLDPVFSGLTAQDLQREIRYLEGEAEIQNDELRGLEEAHATRPYRPDFMATMRRGYGDSLRQLHSEIAAVRAVLNAKEALRN